MTHNHIIFVYQLFDNGLTLAEIQRGFKVPLRTAYRYINQRYETEKKWNREATA